MGHSINSPCRGTHATINCTVIISIHDYPLCAGDRQTAPFPNIPRCFTPRQWIHVVGLPSICRRRFRYKYTVRRMGLHGGHFLHFTRKPTPCTVEALTLGQFGTLANSSRGSAIPFFRFGGFETIETTHGRQCLPGTTLPRRLLHNQVYLFPTARLD